MNCISFTLGDDSAAHSFEKDFINLEKVMYMRLYTPTHLEVVFEGNVIINYKGRGMSDLYDIIMKKTELAMTS